MLLTISLHDVRSVGAQRPRLSSVPPEKPGDDVGAGEEAVDLAASAGLHLDEWQRTVLVEALRERASGKFAAFEVGLVVPRQNGKGSVLEALELAGIFLFGDDGPPPLILHSAHEFKTSAEHFRRMRDLVDGSDHLRKKVRIVRTAAGSESIELVSGARLRFVTRTGGSGRGFTADTLVLDEAYNLSAESMAAILPTLSARRNPQVWYTSSAGMVSSEQLARIRERGRSRIDKRLAYFEWSAPDDADPGDPATWAQANPALGIRIPMDFVEAERSALPAEQFARERLGMWAARAFVNALDVTLWGALADPEAERGAAVVFGVDVDEARSASVAAAWTRPDGRPQVMLTVDGSGRVDTGLSTAAAHTRLVDLAGKWGGQVALGGPADVLEADLVAAGVQVVAVSGSDFAQACGAVADAVASGGLRHGNQEELDASVRGARWRSVGTAGERAWQLKGAMGIGPLAAVTRALHGLMGQNQTGPNLW